MGLGAPVAQLMAVIGLNTAPLEAGIAKSTGLLSKTGPLAIATLGAGALLAGTGVIATKMAGDFQAGITSLATGAGESTKNLKMVSDGIIQLAKDTGTSTQQLIDGMYMIESGGFHGAAGLAILKAAAEGAKVGNADLGAVADSVDTILKNFGEGGMLSATQATNALITTVANGKTHLEDLAQSLAFVLPAGAAAGLGLKDVLGAMATLTSVGVPAAESATYLRQTIIALEAPSQGAKDALAAIGISADQLGAALKKGLPDALQLIQDKLKEHGIKEGTAQYVAAIREISGGTRQMQGMLNLMGPHLEVFKEDVAKIGGAASTTGTQVKGWELTQKTFNVQIARAGEVVKTLMIQLGEKLLPVATKLFNYIADNAIPALKNFHDFITQNTPASVAFKIALAALAGVIAVNLVMAFGAWAASAVAALIPTIALLWPVYAVAAAIGILVAGIIWAYQNFKPFHDLVDAIVKRLGGWGNAIKLAIIIALGPVAMLIAAIVLLVQHWGDITTALGHFKDAVGNFLGHLGAAFGAFFGMIGGAIGDFLGAVGNVLGAIGGFIGRTIGLITSLPARIRAIVQGIVDWILGAFQYLFIHNKYVRMLVETIQRDLAFLRTVFTIVITAIRVWLAQQWQNIQNVAKAAWELFLEYVVKPVKAAWAKIVEVLGGIGGWFRDRFNEVVERARAGWKLFLDVISGLKNTVLTFIHDHIVQPIIDKVTSLGPSLFQKGKDMISALLNGAVSALKSFGNSAIGGVGKVLGFLGFDNATINSLPHFAGGGVMGASGMAWVGESGPEPVFLPSGSRTISHRDAVAALGAGGGGGPIIVQLVVDGRKLAEATVQHMPGVVRNSTGNRRI